MAKIKPTLDDFKPDSRLVDERGPTDERKNKANGHSFKDDAGRQHMRDSPINVALSKKQISTAQFNAAQKFYNHWFRGGMVGNIKTVELNGVFGGSPDPVSESRMFHLQRYWQAREKVGGRRAWALEKVICEEQTFEFLGRAMCWSNRPQAFAAGLTITRDALDILCEDWGIHD